MGVTYKNKYYAKLLKVFRPEEDWGLVYYVMWVPELDNIGLLPMVSIGSGFTAPRSW